MQPPRGPSRSERGFRNRPNSGGRLSLPVGRLANSSDEFRIAFKPRRSRGRLSEEPSRSSRRRTVFRVVSVISFLSHPAMGRRNRGRRRNEGGIHNIARLDHPSVSRHDQSLALESEWGDSPWAAAVQAEQPGASAYKTASVDRTAQPCIDSKSSRATPCARTTSAPSTQPRPADNMPYVFPEPPFAVHKFINLEHHQATEGDQPDLVLRFFASQRWARVRDLWERRIRPPKGMKPQTQEGL